jgi:hypothetical protein
VRHRWTVETPTARRAASWRSVMKDAVICPTFPARTR